MTKLIKLCAIVLLFSFLYFSCSHVRFPRVFKIDIMQGNYISEEQLVQLKLGMSPKQVRHIMGSPVWVSPFKANKWEYQYYLRHGDNVLEKKRVTIFFDNGHYTHYKAELETAVSEDKDNKSVSKGTTFN